MRAALVVALLAPTLGGCGIFFVELAGGGYGVVGGAADLRPAYDVGVDVGVHIDAPPEDPLGQPWRAAIALGFDGAGGAKMGDRDGALVVESLTGRFDWTLDAEYGDVGVVLWRLTGVVGLGGGTVLQLTDATHAAIASANGFGTNFFAGGTLTICGNTFVHLSVGLGGLLVVADGFETTFALGPQARVAFDFGMEWSWHPNRMGS